MMDSERLDRLDAMIAEQRLLRGMWTIGNERACLLAALSPEAGAAKGAASCPATVMPAWLAHMTPNMDDNGTLARWSAMVRRYASLARRWHVLDSAAWERCEAHCKMASLAIAGEHASPAGKAAIAAVVALLERRIAGDEPSADEWHAVGAAAARAAVAAVAAATVAAATAAGAAVWAAEAAATAAGAAARAARAAAEAVAWDRITDATLDAIESECALAGSGAT